MKTPKNLIEEKKDEFEKVLTHLQHELSGIRTGRAHPAIVENIMVECYGTESPIKAVASISIPESRSIMIQPWDRSLLSDIERAIKAANIGVQPVNDGLGIRLNLPALNEERRKEMAKIIGQQAESARVGIRAVREDIWKEVARLQKDGELTEDQKFEAQDELKKIVEGFNDQIKSAAEKKEQEVLTV